MKERKGKEKKRNTPRKETTADEKVPHASKAMRGKKKAKPQGERSIPEATDTHGCKHKRLMELKVLPSDYLMGYMKKGGGSIMYNARIAWRKGWRRGCRLELTTAKEVKKGHGVLL
jgi:hypothetical protein